MIYYCAFMHKAAGAARSRQSEEFRIIKEFSSEKPNISEDVFIASDLTISGDVVPGPSQMGRACGSAASCAATCTR